jgi:hypothetical protein
MVRPLVTPGRRPAAGRGEGWRRPCRAGQGASPCPRFPLPRPGRVPRVRQPGRRAGPEGTRSAVEARGAGPYPSGRRQPSPRPRTGPRSRFFLTRLLSRPAFLPGMPGSLEPRRRHPLARRVPPLLVEPGDVARRHEPDVGDPGPAAFGFVVPDQLGLVQAVEALGRRIVVTVTLCPGRGDRPGLGEPQAVLDGQVLGGFNRSSRRSAGASN